jgi:hypothetical protein
MADVDYSALNNIRPEDKKSTALALAGIAANECTCEDGKHTTCGLAIVMDVLGLKEDLWVEKRAEELFDARPQKGLGVQWRTLDPRARGHWRKKAQAEWDSMDNETS